MAPCSTCTRNPIELPNAVECSWYPLVSVMSRVIPRLGKTARPGVSFAKVNLSGLRLVSASPTGGEATASTTSSTTREATAATEAATATAAERATATTTAGRTTAPSGCATAAATTSSTAGTSGLLDLGCTGSGLGLGKEPVEGQEFVAADVELVAGLEGLGLNAFLGLNGEVDLVQGTANLVDLADGCLVFEVDGRVEVGDLGVDRLAEHLVLDLVDKLAHF
jgi:hypothetical protein